MQEFFLMTKFAILQSIGLLILIIAFISIAVIIFYAMFKKIKVANKIIIPTVIVVIGALLFFFSSQVFPSKLKYPIFLKTFGPSDGPELPLKNVFTFFKKIKNMERVDIAKNPADIPAPLERNRSQEVNVEIETKEVIGEMADGVVFNYWTYNGQVPGPFIRARVGDKINLTIKNHPSSLHHHNIDLHAVNGPGGGATVTMVKPGESKTFSFKALNPGLYVYHCAHPNVATHMTHGMYGLILIEPEEGLPKVDKEFYVMQGEFYSAGNLGKKGLQVFDAQGMIDGHPEYIVFNGKTQALNGKMKVNVGDKVRLYVGNGGVNLISSFHVIGEIFDDVYPEAAIGSEPHHNIQTTLVPAGGASIVDFKVDVPGKYIIVDHALARLDRGAWGIMTAEGEENKEIFDGVPDTSGNSGH